MKTAQLDFEAILALPTAVNPSMGMSEICFTACQIACENLGVGHCTFILPDGEYAANFVLTCFPPLDDSFRTHFPVSEIHAISPAPGSGFLEQVTVEHLPDGVLKRQLQHLQIDSFLIVAVRIGEHLYGYLSLESIVFGRIFSTHD